MLKLFFLGALVVNFSAWGYREIFQKYEKLYSLPPNLLEAIALVESGLSGDKGLNFWPWTISANGKGYYCQTKQQAINLVQNLHYQGIQNIDVGCMQINIKYHSKAFKNLDDAFNPELNISFAASYLKKLYTLHQSWDRAIGYYHSTNPSFYNLYLNKISKKLIALSDFYEKQNNTSLVRFHSYKTKGFSLKKPQRFPVFYSKVNQDYKPQIKVRSYQIKLQ